MSAVTDIGLIFYLAAASFNQDLSKWDVSAVTDMSSMFFQATSFKRELCGDAWVNSKAEKFDMFTDSPGLISSRVCKKARTGFGEGGTYGEV